MPHSPLESWAFRNVSALVTTLHNPYLIGLGRNLDTSSFRAPQMLMYSQGCSKPYIRMPSPNKMLNSKQALGHGHWFHSWITLHEELWAVPSFAKAAEREHLKRKNYFGAIHWRTWPFKANTTYTPSPVHNIFGKSIGYSTCRPQQSTAGKCYCIIKAFRITLKTIWGLYATEWITPPYHGINMNV